MRSNLFKHGVSALILTLFAFLALGGGSAEKAVKETPKEPEPVVQESAVSKPEWESNIPAQARELHDQGLVLLNEKQYDQAITQYTEAIKLYPRYAGAYAGRGRAYDRKGDYDRAMADAGEALSIDPNIALAYNVRGNAYLNKKDYDRAIADYSAAIRIDPNYTPAYNNRGNAYLNKKDYDRAIADYSAAIRIDPNYANTYNDRGVAYQNKEDYDRAIADYSEALRIDPNHAFAYNNRGNAYQNKEDYDRAIVDYTEAIRIDPNHAYAYNNRGGAYFNKKDYDRAIADYSEAIRIDPDFALAKNNLELARIRASYNPAKFTLLPSDFNPADYQKRDLFDAVASVEKMPRGSGSLFDGVLTTFKFASDVVFATQDGTDIYFKTADNAITQHMKIGSRSGLTPGQKVRIYYTVKRNPYTEWNVDAIEKL
jgi:tetratricopeptide (TPR) repeat protein